ncbi:four-carbon acid sugar kinase family protein [Variovorax sp. HJSM1_2]|uniref:four-carbon acid sugar kinase family protein n=1 Tax=Variovorax sp. HJSM1_2 TaxID=3366263 RepID=UPI003BED790F
MQAPRIVYYADDFTGATDTLANAARAGLRALLFLALPTAAQRERAGALDCLGIAGAARAMAPEEMATELAPVGAFFAASGARVLHYKCCSTFDSAPHVGSIGQAVRSLRPYAPNQFVPIVGGQPNLGRYCVFGNLFAAAGSGGTVYRIDRHPTMRQHPVTPMHEADLRQHLALQGLEAVAGLAYPVYHAAEATQHDKLEALQQTRPDAVLLDVAEPAHLAAVGGLIWREAQQQPLLAVGPSSVVQALTAHWAAQQQQQHTPPAPSNIGAAVGPVLVLVGSLSPITAQQVHHAKAFERVSLDAVQLAAPDGVYRRRMAAEVSAMLRKGQNVLACTSSAEGRATEGVPAGSRSLAQACGDWLAQVLQASPLRRVGIAGGDTSSLAVQSLDAWGLSHIGQVSADQALCRVHSDNPTLDGMELMLKGGQMGPPDVFERLIRGA